MTDPAVLARLKEHLLNQAFEQGYSKYYVEGDPTSVLHEGKPYAYTIGRSMFARPEFLVTGMSEEESSIVLEQLVAMDDRRHPSGGRPPAPAMDDVHVPIELPTGTTAFRLIHADPSGLVAALVTFGINSVTCVQALWPRPDGTYPQWNARFPEQPMHPHGRSPLVDNDPYGGGA